MHTDQPLAPPKEIRAFVEKEYPQLAGGRISIGLWGDHYRVVVEDASHVLHTLHIPLETQRSAPIANSSSFNPSDLLVPKVADQAHSKNYELRNADHNAQPEDQAT